MDTLCNIMRTSKHTTYQSIALSYRYSGSLFARLKFGLFNFCVLVISVMIM